MYIHKVFFGDFSPFCELFLKKEHFLKKILFFEFFFVKNEKLILKICHNCLQHERVFKIFLFDILNAMKFDLNG